MGKPDLFAKRTFASQTATITRGAVSWRDAPEIGVESVTSDGILVIHDLIQLQALVAPWNLVEELDEILLEFKMQGDHVDRCEVSRTLTRRQVRETQRLDATKAGKTLWLGSQTLWLTSAYVPDWARARYRLDELARGCYRFLREDFTALWIASNELPLCDELVPFLITRTGRALRDFLDWVLEKNAWPLLDDLLVSFNMLPQGLFSTTYSRADEQGKRNIRGLISEFLVSCPEFEEELNQKAALREAREAVKRNLRVRRFDVRPGHLARIDGCTDLDTLHRWHDRAVTAASVDEALAEI